MCGAVVRCGTCGAVAVRYVRCVVALWCSHLQFSDLVLELLNLPLAVWNHPLKCIVQASRFCRELRIPDTHHSVVGLELLQGILIGSFLFFQALDNPFVYFLVQWFDGGALCGAQAEAVPGGMDERGL